jgi:hypothetical protein
MLNASSTADTDFFAASDKSETRDSSQSHAEAQKKPRVHLDTATNRR